MQMSPLQSGIVRTLIKVKYIGLSAVYCGTGLFQIAGGASPYIKENKGSNKMLLPYNIATVT